VALSSICKHKHCKYGGKIFWKSLMELFSLAHPVLCFIVICSKLLHRGHGAIIFISTSMHTGTADNGNLHAFDVTEYQLLVTWSFDDDVTSSKGQSVTSVTCSSANHRVAAAAGQRVKIWDIRCEKVSFFLRMTLWHERPKFLKNTLCHRKRSFLRAKAATAFSAS